MDLGLSLDELKDMPLPMPQPITYPTEQSPRTPSMRDNLVSEIFNDSVVNKQPTSQRKYERSMIAHTKLSSRSVSPKGSNAQVLIQQLQRKVKIAFKAKLVMQKTLA